MEFTTHLRLHSQIAWFVDNASWSIKVQARRGSHLFSHPVLGNLGLVRCRGRFSRLQFKGWGLSIFKLGSSVATPLWTKCEDETRTPKSENLESYGTPANSELDCRGQKNLHWNVPYTVGKVLKCRCPKWPCMSHLDICSPSYGQKKGWESNWQFHSRPLKVENQPDSNVSRRSAISHWKALKENYKIALDLISIGGLSRKLWMPKVPGLQPEIVSGLLFRSSGKKCHSDVAPARSCKEYYMGEGGDFPRVRAVVSQVSPRSPVASPNTTWRV